jgi:hypothetical protein
MPLSWSLVALLMSSQMTRVQGGGAAAAAASSSFPAPLPDRLTGDPRAQYWLDGGGGGASSDDEGDDEDGMSSEEFEDHEEAEYRTPSWFHHYEKTSSIQDIKPAEEIQDIFETSRLLSQLPSFPEEDAEAIKTSSSSALPPALPSDRAPNTPVKSPQARSPSREEEKTTAEIIDDSPPLQTIHKLRQMLDETDYLTSAPRRNSDWREASSTRVAETPQMEGSSTDKNQASQAARELSNGGSAAAVTSMETGDVEEVSTPNLDTSFTTSPATASTSSPNMIDPEDRLWTSKDRSKYKKAQNRLRPRRGSPPIHLHSSDDEASDNDDGLGYILPNVPVYYSDGEESEDVENEAAVQEEATSRLAPQMALQSSTETTSSGLYSAPSEMSPDTSAPLAALDHQPSAPLQSYVPPYPPQGPHQYGPQQQEQQQAMVRPYNPYLYNYPYAQYQQPYGPYAPPQQQYPYPHQYPQWGTGGYPSQQGPPQALDPSAKSPSRPDERLLSTTASAARAAPSRIEARPSLVGVKHPVAPFLVDNAHVDLSRMAFAQVQQEGVNSLAEASSYISFDAIQKIGLLLVSVALGCYAGVSPRTLPLTEYNLKFYENFRLIALAFIAPAIKLVSVFDASVNDVNDAVTTFFASFTLAYPVAFLLEIVATTIVRLAVFAYFEPKIFSLAPKVPIPLIPWTLRENRYRPKRITLLAAEFCASCVASPLIEEYVKLKTLQWSTKLSRNFRWVKKKTSKKHRRRWVAEPVVRQVGESDVLTANQYVTQMLAASIGMKLCDAGRRILMYTKASHANKSFYAFCRGLFPIHELCGTMTAIALAKRDLLGVRMPMWKMLFPAVLIHGMANMRGKKPIFRWGSATPWSEMQLSPLGMPDASTLPKLLSKGFAKLMWVVLLSRVLGYCIKNYYMVNRQAVKRTTRYAGNHAAFSAELATAELLKKK